jgi:hypothetical protein
VKKCIQLSHFPHVCNGCRQKTNCYHEKQYYRAKVAQANYKDVLTSCREGIGMTPVELNTLDDLISPLILKGQSIAHIFAHHKREIICSERTLYNYFDMNAFAARNIDLPRRVRYKPRKKTKLPKKSGAYRIGRTYEDFNAYLASNPGTAGVNVNENSPLLTEKIPHPEYALRDGELYCHDRQISPVFTLQTVNRFR